MCMYVQADRYILARTIYIHVHVYNIRYNIDTVCPYFLHLGIHRKAFDLYIHTYIHRYIHTYIHTTHTHTYIHIYIHAYIHTQIWDHFVNSSTSSRVQFVIDIYTICTYQFTCKYVIANIYIHSYIYRCLENALYMGRNRFQDNSATR